MLWILPLCFLLGVSVLGFPLRSLICFELILAYDVKWRHNCILLHADILFCPIVDSSHQLCPWSHRINSIIWRVVLDPPLWTAKLVRLLFSDEELFYLPSIISGSHFQPFHSHHQESLLLSALINLCTVPTIAQCPALSRRLIVRHWILSITVVFPVSRLREDGGEMCSLLW